MCSSDLLSLDINTLVNYDPKRLVLMSLLIKSRKTPSVFNFLQPLDHVFTPFSTLQFLSLIMNVKITLLHHYLMSSWKIQLPHNHYLHNLHLHQLYLLFRYHNPLKDLMLIHYHLLQFLMLRILNLRKYHLLKLNLNLRLMLMIPITMMMKLLENQLGNRLRPDIRSNTSTLPHYLLLIDHHLKRNLIPRFRLQVHHRMYPQMTLLNLIFILLLLWLRSTLSTLPSFAICSLNSSLYFTKLLLLQSLRLCTLLSYPQIYHLSQTKTSSSTLSFFMPHANA